MPVAVPVGGVPVAVYVGVLDGMRMRLGVAVLTPLGELVGVEVRVWIGVLVGVALAQPFP